MTIRSDNHYHAVALLFLLIALQLSYCSASTVDVFSINRLNVAGSSEFGHSLQWVISDSVTQGSITEEMNLLFSTDSVAWLIAESIDNHNGRRKSPTFFSGKEWTGETVTLFGHQVAVAIPVPASIWLLGFGLMGLSFFKKDDKSNER
jgi:hypothetical protein